MVVVAHLTLTFHSIKFLFSVLLFFLFPSSFTFGYGVHHIHVMFCVRTHQIKGYVTESSGRSSRTKRTLPLTQKKNSRRSQSASGTTNLSTMSARPLSRMNSTNTRTSRSKFRTPGNRLQTMSADRSIMNPVTPKIKMNTPISLLRYPKVGETVISMSGSPVIVNG